MAFSFSVTHRLNGGGVSVGSSTINFTGSSQLAIQETIADGATDTVIAANIDVSALVVFAIVSTQDVTIKTNSSGTPDDTITLTANVPELYSPTVDFGSDPFASAVDVTSLLVTNGSGSAAEITVAALTDSTP